MTNSLIAGVFTASATRAAIKKASPSSVLGLLFRELMIGISDERYQVPYGTGTGRVLYLTRNFCSEKSNSTA